MEGRREMWTQVNFLSAPLPLRVNFSRTTVRSAAALSSLCPTPQFVHVPRTCSISLYPPFRFLCRVKGSDSVSDLELSRSEDRRLQSKRVSGIFWILLLNISIYLADHLFMVKSIKSLYLYHCWPAWYQFITSTFCHASWNHLSSNLFFLYIFGKLVEEEEGNFGLWLSYILTGAGANVVSWLVLPKAAVSVGASGAVFGLFAISVLVKLSFDWRKILEVLILGQFIIEKVLEAAQASANIVGPLGRGSSMQGVNHLAHLSGALIGAALVLLLSKIPFGTNDQDNLRGMKDARS